MPPDELKEQLARNFRTAPKASVNGKSGGHMHGHMVTCIRQFPQDVLDHLLCAHWHLRGRVRVSCPAMSPMSTSPIRLTMTIQCDLRLGVLRCTEC